MKKMILTAMVLVLASLFTVQAQSRVISSKKVYSLDKYDGFIAEVRGGHNSLILDNNLVIIGGGMGSTNATSFVTFDLSQINLSDAKSITMSIYQMGYNQKFRVDVALLMVDDNDYQHWQNCRIDQFGNNQKIIQGRHEPKNCGFAKELPGGTWYEVIRCQVIADEVKMSKASIISKKWQSENLLPMIRTNFAGKKYLTIGLGGTMTSLNNKIWQVEFADGNRRNTIFRPYLEVRY